MTRAHLGVKIIIIGQGRGQVRVEVNETATRSVCFWYCTEGSFLVSVQFWFTWRERGLLLVFVWINRVGSVSIWGIHTCVGVSLWLAAESGANRTTSACTDRVYCRQWGKLKFCIHICCESSDYPHFARLVVEWRRDMYKTSHVTLSSPARYRPHRDTTGIKGIAHSETQSFMWRQNGVKVKVHVWDEDGRTGDDFVDSLQTRIMVAAAASQSLSHWTSFIIRARTRSIRPAL